MDFSLTFNGIRKDYLICERGKRRSAFAPIKRNLVRMPGAPGALLESTETEVRIIEQPIIINAKNRMDERKLEEDLAAWLITEQPAPLIFDEEPDRVYYAAVDGALNIEDIARFGRGTITFICPDPYKYGSLKSTNPITNLTAPVLLRNEGTVEAMPNIKVTLKQSTTYLDIVSDDSYMRIGRPADIDKTAVDEKQTVLHDTMSTVIGWGVAANTDIDSGSVVGTMTSDGSKFIASSLGTGTSWHGPALIKSLGQELTDFEVEFQPILDNDDLSKIGRIEIYLLDVNKQAVGKLAIKDMSKGQGGNIVELRAGDRVTNHFLINEYGTNWNTWHDFNGVLQLTRKGNKWAAYVAKFINGQSDQRTSRKLVEWTDVGNSFTRKVAHVVVHIGTYGTSTPSQMSIQDLKVYKLNQLTESEIPYIGAEGDVFEFDMKSSRILKNGDFFNRKDFGARFFGLRAGDNSLVFNPPEVFGLVEVEWRPPYR